jgi:hypothetical protein
MFYRFRLLQFHVLQIPAFTIPCFTDSGFYNSMFYRFRLLQFHIMFYGFRLLQFRVLQIPAFTIPCSTDSGFCNSGSFHSPFHSVPGFPFRVLQVARSKQILSRVVIITLVVVAQYYLFLELLWLRGREGLTD